jgi:hypothetical protein
VTEPLEALLLQARQAVLRYSWGEARAHIRAYNLLRETNQEPRMGFRNGKLLMGDSYAKTLFNIAARGDKGGARRQESGIQT